MNSGIYWSKGARVHNEDTLALEELQTDWGECALLVVADGIGSLPHGEIVSGYVTECFVKWFYKNGQYMRHKSKWKIKRSLLKTFYDCHVRLRDVARRKNIKIGSTCSVVCMWNSRYVYLNIGDSVICTHRRCGRNKSLTILNSRHRKETGELYKCIGSMKYDRPDINFGHIHKNEGILVATDGFTDKLEMDEISTMLNIYGEISRETIEYRLRSVGREIAVRGGSDNRSAIYFCR